jgi:predicted TIM-barrel fold metal-dependent hydrolase
MPDRPGRGHCRDALGFKGVQVLRALVDTFGADRILMGTDYPFDTATIAAICGGNARRLLG